MYQMQKYVSGYLWNASWGQRGFKNVKISWKAGLPGGVLIDGNSESSVGE